MMNINKTINTINNEGNNTMNTENTFQITETTLQFHIQQHDDIEAELNALLEVDGYKCNVFESVSDVFSSLIICVETNNRADAEKYYKLLNSWALNNSISIDYSAIL